MSEQPEANPPEVDIAYWRTRALNAEQKTYRLTAERDEARAELAELRTVHIDAVLAALTARQDRELRQSCEAALAERDAELAALREQTLVRDCEDDSERAARSGSTTTDFAATTGIVPLPTPPVDPDSALAGIDLDTVQFDAEAARKAVEAVPQPSRPGWRRGTE